MTGLLTAARFTIPSRRAAAFSLALLALPSWAQTRFVDPLDTPAAMRTALAQRPLMALTKAGERLVAAGPRGLIIVSDDRGKTWVQAKVPVQSDLLSVHFPSASDGWAVGHDGVILHSGDGGKTWAKQLDGRTAAQAFKAFYRQAGAGPEAAAALAVLEQNFKAGPAMPFLDVWFEDSQRGFAVGSFGMIAATGDGGKTWEPWLHRIDNGQSLNLNAIRGIGGDVYIAGERGRIYRLDRALGRFAAIDTGYAGSFFGIAGSAEALVAFGLRGTAYRSAAGESRWEPVSMPNQHTITAGMALSDGSGFLLANAAGQMLLGDREGKRFRLLAAAKPMRLTGIAPVDAGTAVATGLEGVSTEAWRTALPAQP